MSQVTKNLLDLLEAQRSLVLATVNEDGTPLASYAPFVYVDGAFHVLLSSLAAHEGNVARGGDLSVMIIEDESRSEEVFARRRATFRCRVTKVDGGARDEILDRLAARCGEVVETLRALADFTLYRLEAIQGSYVEGFARAYTIDDPGTLTIRHRKRS